MTFTYTPSKEAEDKVNDVYNKLMESAPKDDIYHVKLQEKQEIDLYFINYEEIKVLWKKFPGEKQPPIIATEKPTGEDKDEYKETVVFKIYDPAQDKEGFIEFTAISTARDILTFLKGDPDKKIAKTNFLNIFRSGSGKATRYVVRPAK